MLLSIGLHVLLIAAWQSDSNTDISIHGVNEPLLLSLSANKPQQAAKQTTKTDEAVRKPARQRVTIPSANNTPAKIAPKTTSQAQALSAAPAPKTQASKSADQQAASTTDGHRQRQQVGARIQKQLRVKIAFNKHYPGIAIRNAWQGRVKLGIRVQANGNLTHIHVINSSGYRMLDKAAVKSVHHIAALPEASAWLQGQPIDVILPVIYQLTDS